MAPDICPACHADLRGELIPEASRELFGNATHFLRAIGIYDISKDRTTHWLCPDCNHKWVR